MSKVAHSQALSVQPLRPWIVINEDGSVETAHCTCMAGLGEACSHIAATLFAIETAVEMLRDTTSTSLPCSWVKTCEKVNYAEGNDIAFIKPAKKRCLQKEGLSPMSKSSVSREIPLPTSDDNNKLYDLLKDSGVRCAVLSLVPKYAADYIPKSIKLGLPEPLSTLYNKSKDRCKQLPYKELVEVCSDVFSNIKVTQEQVVKIELETRGQTDSKIWQAQRTGRITASNVKSACRTDPARPSVSLIKRICYPDAYTFSTPATRYGCTHEKEARELYAKLVEAEHQEIAVSVSGLHIHPKFPYLGASPDGHVTCLCHGFGVLEIKCPFCLSGKTFESVAKDSNFCLEHKDGVFRLNRTHTYYYQVQLQFFLSEANYCDFIVWQKDSIFVERILLDMSFLDVSLPLAKKFYIQCVLPELVVKWFSCSDKFSVTGCLTNIDQLAKPCYCQQSDISEDIVVCQSDACTIMKFHLKCLGLKAKPKRKWFCPDCRIIMKKKDAED